MRREHEGFMAGKPSADPRSDAFTPGWSFSLGEISHRTFLRRAAALLLSTLVLTAVLAGARPAVAQDREDAEHIEFAIDGTNNLVLAYYDDDVVTGGTTRDLRNFRQGDPYLPARGYEPEDIVGIAVDGDNNFVFAWYRDGMVSAGESRDLGNRREAAPYVLPEGYEPDDIVGMAIDGSNNLVVAWYDDNKVSYGSSTDLDSQRALTSYALAREKTPADIVGMGCDGFVTGFETLDHITDLIGYDIDDDVIGRLVSLAESEIGVFGSRGSLCFAWYDDGTVSAGKSTDLGEARVPYSFER